MNPVNEYLGPYILEALAPLVELGVLKLVYGAGDVGKLLCNHAAVHDVHITGSDKTYDAIVWQGRKKEAGAPPPYPKHVGAELGCVTPYIVVPVGPRAVVLVVVLGQ